MGAGVGLRDRWPTWTLGGRPLRAAMIVGALCGLVAALTEGPWGAAILAATLAAVVAGLLRPSALLALIAIAVVAVPSYVGWLVPGGLFFNMARGVIYGAAVGLILWTMAQARNELPWPKGDALSPMSRIAILSLTLGWMLAPLIGLAHGGGNAFRAFNAVLYQALPLWVGLRFASEYGRRRTLQVVLALLILYTVPYWLYELEFAKSAFKSYVPPIPGLLGAEELLMRGGNVRVQATFGHPLAFDQFLVLAAPIAATLLFVPRLRLLGLLAAGAGVMAVWATQSRSPWIALLGGVAGTVAFRRPLLASMVVISVAFVLVFTPLGDALGPRALASRAKQLAAATYSARSETEFSAASRVFLTISSVRAISQHPLTGYGVNVIGASTGIPTVDNYFLVLPLEIGLLAAGPILLGMVLLWVSISRRVPMDAGAALLAVGVGAYLVQLLLVGLHETVPLLFLAGGAVLGAQSRGAPLSPVPLVESGRRDERS